MSTSYCVELFDSDANWGPGTKLVELDGARNLGWSAYDRMASKAFLTLSQNDPDTQYLIPLKTHVRITRCNSRGNKTVYEGLYITPSTTADDVVLAFTNYVGLLAVSRCGYRMMYPSKLLGTEIVAGEWASAKGHAGAPTPALTNYSFETGDLTGWSSFAGGGTNSLGVVSGPAVGFPAVWVCQIGWGTGAQPWIGNNDHLACAPGEYVNVDCLAAGPALAFMVNWYQSGGTLISNTTVNVTPTDIPTRVSAALGPAPALAAYGLAYIFVAASGTAWVDDVHAASSGETYSRLAFVSTGTIEDPLAIDGITAIKTDTQFGTMDQNRLRLFYDLSEMGRANTNYHVTFGIGLDTHAFSFLKNQGTARDFGLDLNGRVVDYAHEPNWTHYRNDLATLAQDSSGGAAEIIAKDDTAALAMGRWQDVFQIATLLGLSGSEVVSDQQMAAAQRMLKRGLVPPHSLNLQIIEGGLDPGYDYVEGDTAPVQIVRGSDNINTAYRIMGTQVFYDNGGEQLSVLVAPC